MTLQQSILKQFKERYPKLTLKRGSELTGINSSRLFRLLNGSEMKLGEYEILQNLLKGGASHQTNQFIALAYKFQQSVSSDEINKVEMIMDNRLQRQWILEHQTDQSQRHFLQSA
jgi:hypothetical protein